MRNRRGLKNHAECTSQNVKRTSGARVMTCLRLVILFRLRTDCPSDRPSIQSRARPTDSPSRLTETQNKYCVGCYDIYSIHSHYKGNHKGGRAAPFVVAAEGRPFVLALKKAYVSERASDRVSERSSERVIDGASERPSERATERPSDRATERPKKIITRAPDVHLTR